MEWIDIEKLSKINVVEDFNDLLKVMNDPDLNEFQYTIEDGERNPVTALAACLLCHNICCRTCLRDL